MRTSRYAWIDLAQEQVKICDLQPETIENGRFGFGALRDLMGKGEDMLVLSTGLLTGTGVPGSGTMVWCYYKNGSLQCCPAEGRMGAMLRCAGIDHLIFSGVSCAGKVMDITVNDGQVKLVSDETKSAMLAAQAYLTALRNRPSENSVIAVPGREFVIEDDYFDISSRKISVALRRMGVRSITVAATGGIEIAEPMDYLDQCIDLWRAAKETAAPSDMEHPVNYCSVKAGTDKNGEDVTKSWTELKKADSWKRLMAALGLAWDETASMETVCKLVSAYLGKTVTEGDLQAACVAMDYNKKGGNRHG